MTDQDQSWLTPERYYHNTGAAIVPARICHWLVDRFNLDAVSSEIRGQDKELDMCLIGIRLGAVDWRTSGHGTSTPATREAARELSQWVSTATAAGLIGITTRAVCLAIQQHRLPAEWVEGRWRIARADVEHYRAARAA